MHFVVIGSGSYVASRFRAAAEAKGHRVTGYSSRPQQGLLLIDMTREESIKTATLPEGPIDGVLFCQGINPSKGLADADFEHMGRMFAMNIAGPTILVRRLLPLMRPGASFVFLGSAAVRRGSYDPAYGACKSALQGLINSFARYEPQVRFNQISLALVEGSPVAEGMPEERRKLHSGVMFGGHLVSPSNIAELALHIFQNENINRADFPLDGGMWA